MKNRIIILSVCLLLSGASFSQVCQDAGLGTATPHSTLEIRGCTNQSNASALNVTDSNAHTIFFVRDDHAAGFDSVLYYWPLTQGAVHTVLTDSAGYLSWSNGNSTGWSLTGNSGTVDGTNFIGTTDNVPLNFKVNNVPSGRIDNTGDITIFGYGAGHAPPSISGASGMTAIGYAALGSALPASGSNTAVGQSSLGGLTSGVGNTAMGNYSLLGVTTAINNTSIGAESLNTGNGSNNTAIGTYSMGNAGNGSNNTSVGYWSLFVNSIGRNNCAFGDSAGYTNTSGSRNSYFGSGAGGSATNTNSVAIGYQASATSSNTIILGNSNDTTLYIQGAIALPQSTSTVYGTSGQALLSGGIGGKSYWGTMAIAAGGTGGTYISTDTVGSDSNSFYVNGHSKLVENDSVYYTTSSGNNGGWGVKINVTFNNIVDGETVNILYYKKTTKYSLLTFPSNSGAIAYTISQSSHGITSGQTFTCASTTGTSLYEIKIQRFAARYIVSIIQITP